MMRGLVTRLEAIEDRRVERLCRANARKDGMTAEEIGDYLASVRREIARLRAGLRPRTLTELAEERADELGLTGDRRAAFLAKMTAEVESEEAGQSQEV